MDVNFSDYFHPPNDYKTPIDGELEGNTQFPNLNSTEYRNRTYTPYSLPFFETIATNDDQSTILLAANSYVNRLWDGALFVYRQFEDVGQDHKEELRLSFDSNLNGMRFLDKTFIILTTSSGSIQIWSTQSEVRQKDGYSLYQISKRSEHFGVVHALDILSKNRAVTGSSDGCIKIWDIESCDLTSSHTYRYAHCRAIHSISSKPDANTIFASCSSDKILSIWDVRDNKPIVDFFENEVGNSTCLWHSINGIDKIYMGDDAGIVHVFDPRKLASAELTEKIYKRTIHKIDFNQNNDYLCVLGSSETVKVFDKAIDGKIVYENSDADDYVRDICWMNAENKQQNEFYSIGWNKHVKKHIVNEH